MALSLAAIAALSPVLLACALAVKATSPGPVLFRQERWGRAGTRFTCWKFRTMLVEAPPDLPAKDFAGKAAFMTPVGPFLRKWSLDELPQLANILKGDMSVVGPRPVIVRERRLVELRAPLNADAVRPASPAGRRSTAATSSPTRRRRSWTASTRPACRSSSTRGSSRAPWPSS